MSEQEITNTNSNKEPTPPPELTNQKQPSSPGSSASESDWVRDKQPVMRIVKQMIENDIDPRFLCDQLGMDLPDDMPRIEIFRLLIRVLGMKAKRKRTRKYNLSETIDLIRNAKKILVLTGAGISVSCGIPDFRSRDGLYAKLAVDFPELPDPQSMFCLKFFKSDPRPFFRFAKEIFPGNFLPSPSHRFIAQLEKNNKMKRLYSQNIDGLEQQAGIENVIQCHGHFYTARCLDCKAKYEISELKDQIMASEVPHCPRLVVKHTIMEKERFHEEMLLLDPVKDQDQMKKIENEFNEKEKEICNGVIKPDIVFFGEPLPSHFHRHMAMDQDDVDLLIVMGSSLKVGPVNDIPDAIDENVPRILINREPLPHMPEFESELLGNCDEIVEYISMQLGFDIGMERVKTAWETNTWETMCEKAKQISKRKIEEKSKKIPEEKNPNESHREERPGPIDPSVEPPIKKQKVECVPIEEPPENESAENVPESDCDSNSDIDSEEPCAIVELGEYISPPSGYQTLFHGCELPIKRLLESEDDSDDSHSEEESDPSKSKAEDDQTDDHQKLDQPRATISTDAKTESKLKNENTEKSENPDENENLNENDIASSKIEAES